MEGGGNEVDVVISGGDEAGRWGWSELVVGAVGTAAVVDGEMDTGVTPLKVVTKERVKDDNLDIGLLIMYKRRAVRRS